MTGVASRVHVARKSVGARIWPPHAAMARGIVAVMRLGCCAVLALAACYAPKVAGGVPCDLADPESCPIGQRCEPAVSGGRCSDGTPPQIDAGPGRDADPGSDASVAIDANGAFCIGANLLGTICLASKPTLPLRVDGALRINTASTNTGDCTEIRPQPGGPSLCVVAAASVDITALGSVRGIGPNPLVLIAAHTIAVEGSLDVASRVGDTVGNVPVFGAGARNATECNAIGLDGKPSDGGNQGLNGGGGGGGGSFGGLGGTGGNGRGNIRGGIAVAGTVPPVLIGGCPGGHGGDGTDGGGGANGGGGGGAVYLLAGDSVSIAGSVNASGAGGDPGGPGGFSGGGGGGGGSGGVIGIEAPAIAVTGSLFANGGGGGGGANKNANFGGPGGDAVTALVPAAGGSSSNGGGAGGAGSVVPKLGAPGSGGSQDQCGGGGGGGGGGVIKVFGDPSPEVSTSSPPPS